MYKEALSEEEIKNLVKESGIGDYLTHSYPIDPKFPDGESKNLNIAVKLKNSMQVSCFIFDDFSIVAVIPNLDDPRFIINTDKDMDFLVNNPNVEALLEKYLLSLHTKYQDIYEEEASLYYKELLFNENLRTNNLQAKADIIEKYIRNMRNNKQSENQ